MPLIRKTHWTFDLFDKWRFGYTHDEVWNHDELYLERWILWFGMTLRLHKFHKADDVSRGIHDHPWWFWTWVLPTNETNFYLESRDYRYPQGTDAPIRSSIMEANGDYKLAHNPAKVPIFGLHYSPPDRRHAITWVQPGTRTLVLTGFAKNRDWGFYDKQGNFTVHSR